MEQRIAERFPTDVEADCRSCDRSWTSRLVNISTTGCMIACPEEGLPNGALLRLRVKGLTAIDGAIVWQHRNHAGIRFQAPLHQAVMEHLANRGSPPTSEVSLATTARPRPNGLHGQLVKRSWADADEDEPRRASA